MPTQLDICNIALSNIGCLPIQSLTDSSESSRLLLLNWDRCIESVLRDFPWAFATQVKYLNMTEDAPPDYAYSYYYPNDCLKIQAIGRDIEHPQQFEVRSNGTNKIIVTDTEKAIARYTTKITDSTLFDASFVEALVYKLSYEINNAKTGNAQQTQEMGNRYQEALNRAYHDQATERRKNNIYPGSYLKARR